MKVCPYKILPKFLFYCTCLIRAELQDLVSYGVLDQTGTINPFSQECVEFMLSSLPIMATPMLSCENKCPRVAAGSNVTLQSAVYTQLQHVAKGGFASVYCGIDSAGNKKALKVCKTGEVEIHKLLCAQIQSPPCSWEVAIVEELHRRLKANNLMTMVRRCTQTD